LDTLRAAGVRSTFFLTSSLARQYERLSRRLAEAGEIGTHGDTHRLLGGLSSRDQRDRLATTQHDLASIVNAPAQGLRPPEEQFDTATMSAWLASRGRYLFGANDSRSAAPELLRIGRDTLVLVGRVGSDDFAVAARARGPDVLASLFLGEYDRVRALGGHYVLSYHSQVLSTPSLVPSLAIVARRLAEDSTVWVAPIGEIAEWWRERAAVNAQVRAMGNVLRVVVRNSADRPVPGSVIRVMLPDSMRVVRADTRLLPSNSGSARLFIPELRPRTTNMFTLVLAR
jgi:peptidoglycan/xylan/chitin deacetylase (PgdA/CDA1 family)